MDLPLEHPPFGSADLSNCERELIHLAGSVQPHGALLVLREPDLTVLQLSTNSEAILGLSHDELIGHPVSVLGGDLVVQLRVLARSSVLVAPRPLRCHVEPGTMPRRVDGIVHRAPDGLIVELEPAGAAGPALPAGAELPRRLTAAVAQIGAAPSIAALCDVVVQQVRELAGYDRVMVYRFDADGHGEIVAEARDPRFEPFLGLHYPASDIPQRARELYLRTRVRVLADVRYAPVPVVPRLSPVTGGELDMSLCSLRSMSPLHLQYLKNMGVTATLVASLVKEGRLWGLVACHHYSPKRAAYELRAACELLAEVTSTRLAALEHYAQAEAEAQVRRLEHRLAEALSADGDWRRALFSNPRTLLEPVDATGVALFYDGEILTAGDVPSTPELRALVAWIAGQEGQNADPLFHCSSLARANPALASLTPTASGVLAIKLSAVDAEYLVWFRKEQLRTVTWAGDPRKPVAVGSDPLELSPRRSFAAWNELVRETATPWSASALALARAVRWSLLDIVLQIRGVRMLIGEHQLTRVRRAIDSSSEPVVIADGGGRILLANAALSRLLGRPHPLLDTLDDLSTLFTEPTHLRTILFALRAKHRPWCGELSLAVGAGLEVPVSVRAELVPAEDGGVLGYMLMITDLTERKEAEAARLRLRRALSDARHVALPAGRALDGAQEFDSLMTAILGNATVAAMEITDAVIGPAAVPLLTDVEASTRRAAALTEQISAYSARNGPAA